MSLVIQKNHFIKPWMTIELFNLIKIKNDLYKRYVSNPTVENKKKLYKTQKFLY